MQWLRYRAEGFRLARPVRPCFSCGSTSLGVEVILPAGHLRIQRTPRGLQTETRNKPAGLFYVARFSTLALDAILRLTGPSYAYDRDPALGASYFAAHCETCGALLRDRADQAAGQHAELVEVLVPIVAIGPIEEVVLPRPDALR